jgi:2-polyprenyl-3-methyl-5-hydroxy-6-metoxy-1,4-benzoquinol methylase
VIRTVRIDACPVCGDGPGDVLHRDLVDHLFGADGRWQLRRCSRCRSLWLDPRPSPEDLPKAYADYYTHGPTVPERPSSGIRGMLRGLVHGVDDAHLARTLGYQLPVAWWADILGRSLRVLPGRRAIAEFGILGLPFVAGGRLLDGGSGDGTFVAVAQRLGWAAEGVDNDAAAVSRAQANGLPVRAATLGQLVGEGMQESFDAVTLRHVIEHVEDPHATIGAARELLVPGGRLALATPNAESYLHERFGRAWRGLEPPRHLQIFTRQALVEVVEGHGLVIERGVTSTRGVRTIAAQSADLVSGGTDRRTRVSLPMRATLSALRKPDSGEELLVVARRS